MDLKELAELALCEMENRLALACEESQAAAYERTIDEIYAFCAARNVMLKGDATPAYPGFTEMELNAVAHYQSQHRVWKNCKYTDGRVFDNHIAGIAALYSLAEKGYIRVDHGGSSTYGHTDFWPTKKLLKMDIGGHICPCEGCADRKVMEFTQN